MYAWVHLQYECGYALVHHHQVDAALKFSKGLRLHSRSSPLKFEIWKTSSERSGVCMCAAFIGWNLYCVNLSFFGSNCATCATWDILRKGPKLTSTWPVS